MSPRALASGCLVLLGAGLLWLAVRTKSGPAGPAPRNTAGQVTAAESRPMPDPAPVLDPGPPAGGRLPVPSRPPLSGGDAPAPAPDTNPVIDLTNLIDAAKGDPVLFNYFGAIREQIQQAAETSGDTLDFQGVPGTANEPDSGIVYVSFTLGRDGMLRQAAIVPERSVDSRPLREAALRLVQDAAPFPAFPPSMAAPGATLVVPLEFLQSP